MSEGVRLADRAAGMPIQYLTKTCWPDEGHQDRCGEGEATDKSSLTIYTVFFAANFAGLLGSLSESGGPSWINLMSVARKTM